MQLLTYFTNSNTRGFYLWIFMGWYWSSLFIDMQKSLYEYLFHVWIKNLGNYWLDRLIVWLNPCLGDERLVYCQVSHSLMMTNAFSLDCHIVEIEIVGPGEGASRFHVKTIRTNPAKTGVVTGNATYSSFLSSLLGKLPEVLSVCLIKIWLLDIVTPACYHRFSFTE